MDFFCMIIAALVTAAVGEGSTECDFSKHPHSHFCFGVAGKPLHFHLPDKKYQDISLIKDSKIPILKIVKNQVLKWNVNYISSPEPLGRHFGQIFKLGNATKKHSGRYDLEVHDSEGRLVDEVSVHLQIQAPVMKPVVSQVCLLPDRMRVSCSSAEEGAKFTLTVGRQTSLSGTVSMRDTSGVSNITVSLMTETLRCHVQNNVSSDETVCPLISCSDHFPSVTLVSVASAAGAVTLLLLVVACLIISMKCKKSPRPATVNGRNTEEAVIYSDVRVARNAGNP